MHYSGSGYVQEVGGCEFHGEPLGCRKCEFIGMLNSWFVKKKVFCVKLAKLGE